MQHVPALPKAPVLRVTPGQHVISGFPSKLTQLLLLTDLRAESRLAVEFAIELTRLFTARLTLMHGEPLQSDPTFCREDLPISPGSRSGKTRAALPDVGGPATWSGCGLVH